MRSKNEQMAGMSVCRRTLFKLVGGVTLLGGTSVSTASAQAGDYPEAFDSPLVHEQLWLPDQPKFTDQLVTEQLWSPNRPEFTTAPVTNQSWSPTRPEFSGEPVYTEIWAGEPEPTSPGDIVGNGNPAQDLDGDGLYEDIDGDGETDVFDVQALYNNLDSDAVQNNPEAFNFAGDENPDEVTIFDVQALFQAL